MTISATCHNFFFFNDTATTEIYTLSLHDALPISSATAPPALAATQTGVATPANPGATHADRKSTRLNSSHQIISYAVFCLKKKKKYRSILWHECDRYVLAESSCHHLGTFECEVGV